MTRWKKRKRPGRTHETPRRTGFGVRCPYCNEGHNITIELNDMASEESVKCYDCHRAFGVALARDLVAARLDAWQDLLDFIAGKAGGGPA
jgi:transcription elongation factor Elf1